MSNPIDDLDNAIIHFDAAGGALEHSLLKLGGIKGVSTQRDTLYGISQTAKGLSDLSNALRATYTRLDGLEALIKGQRKQSP